jgi:hypothetical protein
MSELINPDYDTLRNIKQRYAALPLADAMIIDNQMMKNNVRQGRPSDTCNQDTSRMHTPTLINKEIESLLKHSGH